MQMQKIKKVASGALGLFLTGATLFSPALAADLSDFQDMAPANTLIVVGASAATADVVGGINIGAKLAQAGIESATCSVSCEDGGVSTVSDGVKIETSSKKLYLGSSTGRENTLSDVKNTLSSNDFSLLEKQTMEYDDGTTTTMNQYIDLTANTKVEYNEADPEGEIDTPRLILYNAADANMYNMTLTFPTGLDTTDESDNGPGIASESITIMGKSFTFGTDSELGNTSLVLYGGGEEQTLTAGGDAITFELDGETHTIRMTQWVGSGSDDDPLKGVFEVDGKTYTKGDSSTITINAETNSEITIKEVKETKIPSLSGAATEGASADIFIGSAKLTLTNGEEVQKGDDDVDGAVAYITASAAKINEIKIAYAPDDDVTAEAGVPFRDPVFGAFEFVMTGLTPALDSSARDEISVSKNGQKVKLSVPTKDGNTLAVNVYEAVDTQKFTLGIDGKNLFVNATPIGVAKNDYVLVSDGEYSNILQFKGITDSDNLITMRDIGSGDDIEVSFNDDGDGTMYIGSAAYTLSSISESAETFTLDSWAGSDDAPSIIPIVSRNGAVVTILNGTSGSYSSTGDISGAAYFNISEEDTIESESSAEATDFIVSFATKSDSDDIDTISIVSGQPSDFLSIEDGDVSAGLSKYGSLVKTDSNSDYFKMYYPDEQAYANVYVMKAGVEAPTAGAAAGSSVSQTVSVDVPSLGSGVSKLDSEITDADKQEKNLILVGGPYVNNLVEELATKGVTPDAAYWDANLKGSFILQTVEDAFATGKTAIVVSGYVADETRDASLKLATEELSGAAIKCTGSTCSDFVYPAEETEEEAAEEEAAAEEEEPVEE